MLLALLPLPFHIKTPHLANNLAPLLAVHTHPLPVFPDYTENYQQTVVIPAQEEAARVAELKAEADAQEAARLAQLAQEALKARQAAIIPPKPIVRYSAPLSVQNTIIKWANYYGVSSAWLLRVANCESGFNQNATNYGYTAGGGHPHGIFQFLPQTFYNNGGVNYDSYDDQARVAAHMFSIGQSGQWECK